jgi:hypothetical protein
MRHHRRGRNPDANKLIIYHNPTGSATFDPRITTSVSATVIWETEVGRTVTTGTTHNLSYTPTAGPKICKATVVTGLVAVATFDFGTDLLTSIKNMNKLVNCTDSRAATNAALNVNVRDLPRKSLIVYFYGTNLVGSVVDFPPVAQYVMISTCPLVSGSLDRFPAGARTLQAFNCPGISPGSIESWTYIQDARIYSMGWNQAGVDTVISSMWNARANYTYATPSLQIGGTNAAPSGSYIAPQEGANWREDTPGHWVPLTGKAMIYDLINDVNGEGFNIWGITYTA